MPRPKKPTYEYVERLGLYRKRIKDADGKYVALYGKTPDELTEKLTAAGAAIDEAKKYAGNPLVREYAEKWAETKTAGMKPKNKAIYDDAIRLHINPVIGDLRIKDVKPEDAEKVVKAMAGQSASLQGKVLNTLKGIFESAEDNDYISKNPCKRLKNTGYAAKEKDALTDQQVAILLDAVKDTRAETFVMLGLYAGLRREEILGLKWDCVHLDNAAAYIDVRRTLVWLKNAQPIVHEELKTGAASRKVPVPDLLKDHLAEAQGQPDEMVIGPKPYSYTQFKNLWAIIERRQVGERTYRKPRTEAVEKVSFVRKAGQKSRGGNFCYTIDFQVTPHILRHTYITNLILSGVDVKTVQYLAGHKDPSLTLRVYTHIKGKQPEDLIEAVNSAFQVKNKVK